jgi:hypothetical protein
MPRLRLGLVVVGNALVALSALASLGAYSSGDASGLQYILLEPAAWLATSAAAAGAWLGLLSPRRLLAWTDLAVAGLALLVAALPQATGLGYNGAALDAPGTVLAITLVPLAAVAAVATVRGLGPLVA